MERLNEQFTAFLKRKNPLASSITIKELEDYRRQKVVDGQIFSVMSKIPSQHLAKSRTLSGRNAKTIKKCLH